MNKATLYGDLSSIFERLYDSEVLEQPQGDAFDELARALQDSFAQTGALQTVNREGVRASLTTSSTGMSGALSQMQPVFRPFERRTTVRDLIPVAPMNALVVPFVRELPPTSEIAASGVPEGETKPDVGSSISFDPDTATAGVIAAGASPTVLLVEDSAVFAAYLRRRLPFRLALREEVAFIRGNGEDVNGGVVGIQNTADVASASPVAGDLTRTILQLCKLVAANGAEPTAAVVNAADYYSEVDTADTAEAAVRLQILLGLPEFRIVKTIGVPPGNVTVGAFSEGAQIFDRERVNVKAYSHHADYAAKGLVLVQAEERAAFTVPQPWAFAYTTGGSF